MRTLSSWGWVSAVTIVIWHLLSRLPLILFRFQQLQRVFDLFDVSPTVIGPSSQCHVARELENISSAHTFHLNRNIILIEFVNNILIKHHQILAVIWPKCIVSTAPLRSSCSHRWSFHLAPSPYLPPYKFTREFSITSYPSLLFALDSLHVI